MMSTISTPQPDLEKRGGPPLAVALMAKLGRRPRFAVCGASAMVGGVCSPGGVAMVVVRFVGWLLIIAALAVLLNEAWGWYRNGQWATISAGKLWFDLHRDSLLLAQPAIERHVARWLW